MHSKNLVMALVAVIAGWMSAMSVVAVPLAPAKQEIVYEKPKDALSVKLVNAPLIAVLTDVARQSGLEIKADPKVDREVTQEFKALPLADAIERLTTKLNVIKQFREVPDAKDKKKKRSVLVGITVLPAGQMDMSSALGLLDADKEAAFRAALIANAGKRDKTGQRLDFMLERWNARLDGMDKKRRARYEEKLKEEMAREAARQARRDKVEKEAQARRQERDTRRTEMEQRRAAARGEEYKPRQPDPETLKKAQKDFALPQTPAVIEDE